MNKEDYRSLKVKGKPQDGNLDMVSKLRYDVNLIRYEQRKFSFVEDRKKPQNGKFDIVSKLRYDVDLVRCE